MTMDVHQRGLRVEASPNFLPSVRSSPDRISPRSSSSPITEIPCSTPPKTVKRSFDVAFLMAPDDLSVKKRQQHLRLVTTASLMQRYSSPEVTFAHNSHELGLESIAKTLHQQRLLSSRISDFTDNVTPLGLLIPSPKPYPKSEIVSIKEHDLSQDHSLQFAKSAFTKVTAGRMDLNVIPQIPASPSSVSSTVSGGGASPDTSYQESLSPPMITNNSRSPVPYMQNNKSIQPSMSYFASTSKTFTPSMNSQQYMYGHSSNRDKVEHCRSSPVDPNGTFIGNYMRKSPPMMDKLPIQSGKMRPGILYPGENLPYGGLPVGPYPFPGNFSPAGGPMPTHTLLTAAANVTAALLPPSLAALTLPAQNVCAKCKISFRMTSDLVYHMRSHHKGEHAAVDSVRRRREQDKLKCPVCNESFRERHHLTRHMTAHQDKEGDRDEEDADSLDDSRRRNQTLIVSTHK